MHNEVKRLIKEVRKEYFHKFRFRDVLEVGSHDINGSPRKYFWFCNYVGVDIGKGKGVDCGAYGAGLLRSIDIMIKWLEKEIASAKSRNPEPNTPQQIYNDGLLKGYNKMLSVLNARKKNIEERQK